MLSKHKLISMSYWWKSLKSWSFSYTFPVIFRVHWSRFLMDEIAQYKIYIIRNNNDAIWVHITQSGELLFRFPQNSCDSSISDSIVWNRTKFWAQYTHFERWYWCNFCEYTLLGGAIFTFFQEFWGKCRSCVLLNKIAQKYKYKMCIIRNNNYTF